MKQVIDRLDGLEEVLQQLVISINEIKNMEPIKPKITLPNYKVELEKINDKLDQSSSKAIILELQKLSKDVQTIRPTKFEYKQFRFLLFPETNQGQYYKIVFGRLIPWGIVLVIIAFLFSLGQKSIEVWRIKTYNQQAERYIKAWNYMDSHANTLVKKRMDEALQNANK